MRANAKLQSVQTQLTSRTEELEASKAENAVLKSGGRSSPTASGDQAATEVRMLKSKLVHAENEIAKLNKELEAKTEELEMVEAAASAACVVYPLLNASALFCARSSRAVHFAFKFQ